MGALWTAIRTFSFEPSMLIQNIVTVLDVLLVLKATKERDAWWTAILHFFALFLILNLLNAVWEALLHIAGSYFVTHLALLLGYAWYRGLLPSNAVILTVFLFHAIETAAIALSSVFSMVFPMSLRGRWLEILLRNGIVLVTVLFALFFRRHSLLRFPQIQRAMIGYGLLISSVTLFLSIWYNFCTRPLLYADTSLFVLFAFAGVLALNLVAYYLAWAICIYSEREKELLAENYSIKSDRYMLELSQQNLEEMRRIRHDIKNHYSYIQLLNKEHRQDELDQYLAQLSDNWIAPLNCIDCGNHNVSAILNLEMAKAKAKGFALDCRVIVPPELPFAEIQLCSLLTNLIDNAIESCERYAMTDAQIEVGISQKSFALYLCVLNPLPEGITMSEINAERTSKRDTEAHGYGNRIIKSIVKEYNGHMNRSMDNGRFRVDVMLDMQWNEGTNRKKEA